VQDFFQAYLAAPIVILFFVVFKIWKRTSFKRIQDIDVTSGRRELNLAEILAEERALQAKWPRWKKIYKFIC
jgi:amino acid transporter